MQRRPCAFCAEPDRWPDRCGPADETCAECIADRCAWGDHRRCTPDDDCDVAARWLEHVIDAGCAAASAAGCRYGVVSILGDRITVVGTEDHLGRAKSILRSGAARRAGIPVLGPQQKGLVYVVRDDGWLL